MTLSIQGHRGARGLLPENTLPAFERAVEIGVTTLELDCAITRDGIAVVSHDTHLNPEITRDEQGRWLQTRGPAIWSLSYEELARYDVGRICPDSEYARRFPRQQPIDGAPIPRLADVFELVQRSARNVRFNIETKVSPLEPDATAPPQRFVRTLLDTIDAAHMNDRVDIQSFDWRTLAIAQRDAPHIPTVYLTTERESPDNIARGATMSPWTAPRHVSAFGGSLSRMVADARGAAWSPYFEEITAARVQEAHALGLRVVVWTVNDEADMRRMIDLGVDGIISDYPDVLVRMARGR